MRVIAGKYRRRLLKTVPGERTRSTKDRVKESLFNTMMPYIPGKKGLDVFAGSGALGIEGLSRGLRSCDFIERDQAAFDVLEANLNALSIEEAVKTMRADALHTLNQLRDSYDIIMLDPPYGTTLIDDALKCIVTHGLLTEDGFILILCGKTDTVTIPKTLSIYKQRTVGITQILILESGN